MGLGYQSSSENRAGSYRKSIYCKMTYQRVVLLLRGIEKTVDLVVGSRGGRV